MNFSFSMKWIEAPNTTNGMLNAICTADKELGLHYGSDFEITVQQVTATFNHRTQWNVTIRYSFHRVR